MRIAVMKRTNKRVLDIALNSFPIILIEWIDYESNSVISEVNNLARLSNLIRGKRCNPDIVCLWLILISRII